jgi:hypothetical protein
MQYDTGYSFWRGFFKGLVSLLAIGGAIVAFAGFSDLQIWELAEKYLKPLVGSLTVGGAITMAINYFKIRYKASLPNQ